MHNIYLYILVMTVTVYLIRVLPLTLVRKIIRNRFLRSFLYYVPYVTLAVMSFPAMIDATIHPYSGIIAFLVGLIASYKDQGLFKVTVLCCITVLVMEYLFAAIR